MHSQVPLNCDHSHFFLRAPSARRFLPVARLTDVEVAVMEAAPAGFVSVDLGGAQIAELPGRCGPAKLPKKKTNGSNKTCVYIYIYMFIHLTKWDGKS